MSSIIRELGKMEEDSAT
uniref:Uncharacterized protein n=1 Tax=Anguilla anguilla TaxID=7936 RepID=A0A0E9VNX2_ANGAN